jgi:hypothetical protein
VAEVQFQLAVRAYPMHSEFRYPVSPAFTLTDNFAEQPRSTLDTSEDWEFDKALGVAYPASLFVPHNNYVTNENPITSPVWYNANLQPFNWTRTYIGGRMQFMGGVLKTPGLRASWTSEPARSVFYAYAPSDDGNSTTRYNFVPMSNEVDLTSDTFLSNGVYIQLAYAFEARTITWTNGAGGWSQSFTYPAEADARPYLQVWLTCTDPLGNNDPIWFIIVFNHTGNPELWVSLDGTTLGTKIQELKLDGTGNPLSGGSQQGYYGHNGWYSQGSPDGMFIEAMIVAGMLKITLGNPSFPVTFTLNEDYAGGGTLLITQLGIRCVGATSLQIGAAPKKWRNISADPNAYNGYPYLISREIPIGFVPTVDPTTTVLFPSSASPDQNPYSGSLGLCTVDVDVSADGSIIQYTLYSECVTTGTYRQVQYTDVAPIVRGVTISYPESVLVNAGSPSWLSPEVVSITHDFDFNSLTIASNAVLTFCNFNTMDEDNFNVLPGYFWGEWANNAGAIAIEIDLTISYFQIVEGLVEYLGGIGPQRVFTGIANLRSSVSTGSGAQSKYTMYCYSREVAMQSPKFMLPWMDGWNIYYFAAYMANSSNVYKGDTSDSDLAYIDYVPPDPYSDSPGGGAFFLPIGTGGAPLMRASAGEAPWTTITRTGKQFGYVTYFDVYGKHHFETFQLPVNAVPYRIFNMIDSIETGFDFAATATGVFNGSVDRNLMEVRNRVTILGIDAYGETWSPIIAHLVDEGSIYNDSNTGMGVTQGNYLGYAQDFVWADSQFATLQYATDACQRIFNIIVNPSITANINVWCQPDIFPGTCVALNDRRTGAVDTLGNQYLNFFVTKVNHVLVKGMPPRTNLGCRWLPNQTS